MLDRKQIEMRLKGVDPRLCACIALRCSLRVLPLLVAEQDENPFGFWPDVEVSKNLLSLLKAQQAGVYSSITGEAGYSADASAVYTAYGSEAASSVAYSAIYAAEASADANSAASSAGYAALYSSSYKFSGSEEIESEILHDLDQITSDILDKDSLSMKVPEELFSMKLWHQEEPSDWQKMYENFKQALCDLDDGFDVWIDWYESRLHGKPLDLSLEGAFRDIPIEIRIQGVKNINAYLDGLNIGAPSPLNLVRAIFIGDGAVGKTSLIRRLHQKPVVVGEELMTPGIDIKRWPLPESEIEARFWDFGGQVMSHAMHQFFLRERCLYVLLVDAGSEREKREHITANERAEYWLEHIKVYGKSAPVMVSVHALY